MPATISAYFDTATFDNADFGTVISSAQRAETAIATLEVNGITIYVTEGSLTLLSIETLQSKIFTPVISGITKILIDTFSTKSLISSFYNSIVMDNVFKKGSTADPLDATLKDRSGAIDLSTASSVTLYMRSRDGTNKIDGEEMIVINAAEGQVRYNWGATDVNIPGVYHVEIHVNFGGSTIEIFPNTGQNTIRIDENLILS